MIILRYLPIVFSAFLIHFVSILAKKNKNKEEINKKDKINFIISLVLFLLSVIASVFYSEYKFSI
jgi:hypothetical protein